MTDPAFWSSATAALAEALATSSSAPVAAEPPRGRRAAGAAPPHTSERLTLTVKEAATLLGISRVFAREAVRRGEIPSIRFGRPVLVPWVALHRPVGDDEVAE